jgi:hypothetical protein
MSILIYFETCIIEVKRYIHPIKVPGVYCLLMCKTADTFDCSKVNPDWLKYTIYLSHGKIGRISFECFFAGSLVSHFFNMKAIQQKCILKHQNKYYKKKSTHSIKDKIIVKI